MNHLARLVFVVFVACPALLGQEVATEEWKAYKSEVFMIKHRDPMRIASIVCSLGSGKAGTVIQANDMDGDIKTIVVKDFPENIAMIKAAIERLDVPFPESTPVKISMNVIWASKKEIGGTPVSPQLTDVVNEISKTLNYRYFREAAVINHVTKNNSGFGKVLFGLPKQNDMNYFHSFVWEMKSDNSNSCDGCIVSARFNIKYGPLTVRDFYVNIEDAYVNLKENEKVLLGTTTVGDLAMIVVVSAERL